MKKLLIYFLKLAVSGLLALVVLSGFCYFYDNAPIVIEQPSGITNSRFEPNYTWYDMTEGFGSGKTNNIGYNDAQDYVDDGNPVILFLGSSHTEAFHAAQSENFVSLTQNLLMADADSSNDYQCLNLGIANHDFKVTASNFDYVLAQFTNIRYVVIETHKLQYTIEELNAIADDAYHKPLQKEGGLSKLLDTIPVLRLPFLRSLKKQYDRLDRRADDTVVSTPPSIDADAYRTGVDRILSDLSDAAAERGFSIILLYHHCPTLDDQEGLVRTDNAVIVQQFSNACAQHDIRFIDATDTFIEHFEDTHEASYGFMNTVPWEGHLNTVAYKLISNILYKQICELEKVK